VVLVHNPDGVKTLRGYPGDVVLSGHTHGGQVNLPWMWKRFAVLENPAVRRGLYYLEGKWIYVNRGIGSVMKFRWFAVPEILSITLRKRL
jgi:predicted MPP superfamily phosphohydrolase